HRLPQDQVRLPARLVGGLDPAEAPRRRLRPLSGDPRALPRPAQQGRPRPRLPVGHRDRRHQEAHGALTERSSPGPRPKPVIFEEDGFLRRATPRFRSGFPTRNTSEPTAPLARKSETPTPPNGYLR